MGLLSVGIRYCSNLVDMVARQEGNRAAFAAGSRFVIGEVSKLPKAVYLTRRMGPGLDRETQHQRGDSDAIYTGLLEQGVVMKPYFIDERGFQSHMEGFRYPKNYAAGPISRGGVREKKLLEYYISLDLLQFRSSDVVIDVASEWSIFPEMLRKSCGSTVYRQDLIYAPGFKGDRIGGSAANMPIEDEFANKLVLHNAFEHFEGTSDTQFILEAWRVLKPGGILCILPLFMAQKHCILTDPLVDHRSVVWDQDALVIEKLWFHNRFGRFYDPKTLHQRVLGPANQVGFKITIYHMENITQVMPQSSLHYALLLEKPAG